MSFFFVAVPSNLVNQGVVNVMIDVPNRIASCQLLDSFPDTSPFICSITYGRFFNNVPSLNNCDDMFHGYILLATGRARDTVTIGLVQNLNSETNYCYSVYVSYGANTLIITGIFGLCEFRVHVPVI